MNSEWKRFTVEELVKHKIIERPMDGNHGSIHPRGTDFVETGVPFIMASDLKNHHIAFNECKYISEEQANSLQKGFSRDGDVLLTHKATIGRTALIDKLSTPFVMLSPQVTYYRVIDKEKLSNKYLRCYFESEFFQEIFRSWSGAGSTRSYLGITAQHKLPIIIPPINEQKAIADILSSLENKIELNHQMCKTFEDIASTLFKSWFINFDPVKAKAEGRAPEGLSPEIANLFSDGFEDSSLTGSPKGWYPSVIYDWCDYINGAAFKNIHFTDKGDGLPVIKIAELKSGINTGTKFSNTVLDKKYTIRTGDILLSWSGSPDTSIGTFLWVRGKGLLNQHIFKVIPKKNKERPFIYFLLKYFNPTFIKIAKNKQTTGLGHFTVKDLKSLKFIRPDNKLIDEFNTIFDPIFHKIQLIMEEILTLSNLRETLLPNLISGKICVKDLSNI